MTLHKLLIPLFVGACLSACGGGSSDEQAAIEQSQVSIGFSDFPVEAAESVVITVDALVFVPENGDDIRVETFSSSDLIMTDEDTFQFDLLEVQGNDFKLVLDEVTLPVGEYTELRIEVIDENTDLSYVVEIGDGPAVDRIRELKVPSEELKLGAFTVDALSTQTFIVEFDLRQAMTYNPGPQRYILKPRGVRVVGLEQAATLSGTVDLPMIVTNEVCVDVEGGSALYLYSGTELDASSLADNFDASVDTDAPAGLIAPYATAIPDELGSYLFSFVEPGNYTLAYTCLATTDDPEQHDGITIPAPATQIIELSLAAGDTNTCNLPLADGACAAE